MLEELESAEVIRKQRVILFAQRVMLKEVPGPQTRGGRQKEEDRVSWKECDVNVEEKIETWEGKEDGDWEWEKEKKKKTRKHA